jgi:hypothetical protein
VHGTDQRDVRLTSTLSTTPPRRLPLPRHCAFSRSRENSAYFNAALLVNLFELPYLCVQTGAKVITADLQRAAEFYFFVWQNSLMAVDKSTEQISIITEAKLRTNSKLKLVTVKKKTDKYVDELWLKFLMQADVLEGLKITKNQDKSEIELTFAVEE